MGSRRSFRGSPTTTLSAAEKEPRRRVRVPRKTTITCISSTGCSMRWHATSLSASLVMLMAIMPTPMPMERCSRRSRLRRHLHRPLLPPCRLRRHRCHKAHDQRRTLRRLRLRLLSHRLHHPSQQLRACRRRFSRHQGRRQQPHAARRTCHRAHRSHLRRCGRRSRFSRRRRCHRLASRPPRLRTLQHWRSRGKMQPSNAVS